LLDDDEEELLEEESSGMVKMAIGKRLLWAKPKVILQKKSFMANPIFNKDFAWKPSVIFAFFLADKRLDQPFIKNKIPVDFGKAFL
jgi:hypothetical protein